MIQAIATLLIGIVGGIGGAFINAPANYDNLNSLQRDWDNPPLIFGAASFPTSLATLTNPGATDSVATVSHSSQHANANDEIEALEAKVGTGASTAVSGTVLVGDGTGTSRWSTFATTTNLQSTNIVATGSTTLQNFTFVNATGTSATTTNFFSTTASTTNLYGTSANGFGLTSCTGSNTLQWSGGSFSCAAQSSGLQTYATSTSVNMATTTCSVANGCLPNAVNNYQISLIVPDVVGAATTTAEVWAAFNWSTDLGANNTYADAGSIDAAANSNANQNHLRYILSVSGAAKRNLRYAFLEMVNRTGFPKTGSWTSGGMGTTTADVTMNRTTMKNFVYADTGQISSIDFWWDTTGTLFGTSTQIVVSGW